MTVFALLAGPFAVEAAQPESPHRIGFVTLGPARNFKPWLAAFRRGLHDLGHVEGKNTVIVERYAQGRHDQLSALVAELVGLRPDVIVTHGDASATAVDRAARANGIRIPVVMLAVNPVGSGVIASLARPGGNITGLTMDPGPEFYAKRLELLKEIIPGARRFAVFWTPRLRSHAGQLREIETAARVLHATVLPFDYGKFDGLDGAFSAAKAARADALFVIGSSYMGSRIRQLAALSIRYRLPSIYGIAKFPRAGGLLSYGTSFPDLYRRMAGYVHKILNGAKPRDLPFERPSRLELVINLKAAAALGLTIPRAVLLRADEVIE